MSNWKSLFRSRRATSTQNSSIKYYYFDVIIEKFALMQDLVLFRCVPSNSCIDLVLIKDVPTTKNDSCIDPV